MKDEKHGKLKMSTGNFSTFRGWKHECFKAATIVSSLNHLQLTFFFSIKFEKNR